MMKVLLVSGELSGDNYGAQLATELQAQIPGCQIWGVGGAKMQRAGVQILVDSKEMAVIGFGEILGKWSLLKQAFNKTLSFIESEQIDLVVLIDYPGFNLRLAAKIAPLGAKIVYYIPPQLWAWHQSRVKKIRKYIDRCLVILPFEVDFYAQRGVSADYVGHPLLDDPERFAAQNSAPIDRQKRPYLGLMPGSRRAELQRILPVMWQTYLEIKQQCDWIEPVIICADSFNQATIEAELQQIGCTKLPKIISFDDGRALEQCCYVLAKSGTTTLEVALRRLPMTIIYLTDRLTWIISRLVLKIPFVGLPNIIAGRMICREFLQHYAVPGDIAAHVLATLNDPEKYRAEVAELALLQAGLDQGGAAKAAAQVIAKL